MHRATSSLALALLALGAASLASPPAAAVSYVTTDRQTLDALSVPGTTPPVEYATLLSGGSESVGYSNACDWGYFMEPGSSADALAEADLIWTQSGSSGLLFELPRPSVAVIVFPSIDHDPFPNEGIEYTVWGGDSPDLSAFPDGWSLATLVTIYREGWVDSCPGNAPGDESDDFAGLYAFRDQLYSYVVVLPNGSISIFDTPDLTTWSSDSDDGSDPGWQSADLEVDAVGIPDCDAGLVAVGDDASGVVGEPIVLDGSGSLGTIASYGWDLDQDFAVDATGAVVEWSWSTPGAYSVTLSVVGDDGCSDFDTVAVQVCALEEADADGDGHRADGCGGEDCDDSDAAIHPGATEVDDDGVDQDCDGHDDGEPAAADDDSAPAGDDDAEGGEPATPPPADYEGSCACGTGAGGASAATAALLLALSIRGRRRG